MEKVSRDWLESSATRSAPSTTGSVQCLLSTTLENEAVATGRVLVIVAAHSRFITARMLPTRKTEDLLLGSWELIQQIGRVSRRLIWDNEAGIVRAVGWPPA